MFGDAQAQFSDAQALTATADSTNILDLTKARGIGVGENMAVVITLDVAADATDGDETYTAVLKVCATVGGSYAQYGQTVTITRGDAAGTQYVLPLPKDFNDNEFAKLVYTLGGTTPSVTLTAFLVPAKNIQAYKSFPKGYTIS